ncbi:MAG: hypothetical protein JXX29_15435 [Deltaproteobacteria bacterium]|nr:hypothetical protein [Deltaproteobacteria bacterium]MBN2673075.1 hypothetical protein [Deltaproteobacteria bacterium]
MSTRNFTTVFIFLLMATYSFSLLGDGDSEFNRKVSPAGQQILQQGKGAVSDTVFLHIGQRLSKSDFVSAMYGADRANQRIALDAAAYLDDPWPLVPYLVSFMEAAERQAGSTAANSLTQLLRRTTDLRANTALPVSKQATQTYDMLIQVAQNSSLDRDLRVAALHAVEIIQESTGKPAVGADSLFEADDPFVQLAALSLVRFPMAERRLHRVAALASEHASPEVHGTAVAMICENALSHNISTPSDDLKELIFQLFDARNEDAALTPVLGCLSRFPYRVRASITDRVINCKNEKVIKYWKSLTE